MIAEIEFAVHNEEVRYYTADRLVIIHVDLSYLLVCYYTLIKIIVVNPMILMSTVVSSMIQNLYGESFTEYQAFFHGFLVLKRERGDNQHWWIPGGYSQKFTHPCSLT